MSTKQQSNTKNLQKQELDTMPNHAFKKEERPVPNHLSQKDIENLIFQIRSGDRDGFDDFIRYCHQMHMADNMELVFKNLSPASQKALMMTIQRIIAEGNCTDNQKDLLVIAQSLFKESFGKAQRQLQPFWRGNGTKQEQVNLAKGNPKKEISVPNQFLVMDIDNLAQALENGVQGSTDEFLRYCQFKDLGAAMFRVFKKLHPENRQTLIMEVERIIAARRITKDQILYLTTCQKLFEQFIRKEQEQIPSSYADPCQYKGTKQGLCRGNKKSCGSTKSTAILYKISALFSLLMVVLIFISSKQQSPGLGFYIPIGICGLGTFFSVSSSLFISVVNKCPKDSSERAEDGNNRENQQLSDNGGNRQAADIAKFGQGAGNGDGRRGAESGFIGRRKQSLGSIMRMNENINQ